MPSVGVECMYEGEIFCENIPIILLKPLKINFSICQRIYFLNRINQVFSSASQHNNAHKREVVVLRPIHQCSFSRHSTKKYKLWNGFWHFGSRGSRWIGWNLLRGKIFRNISHWLRARMAFNGLTNLTKFSLIFDTVWAKRKTNSFAHNGNNWNDADSVATCAAVQTTHSTISHIPSIRIRFRESCSRIHTFAVLHHPSAITTSHIPRIHAPEKKYINWFLSQRRWWFKFTPNDE